MSRINPVQEKAYQVLVAPLVSEKSTVQAEVNNVVAFVEGLFGVTVEGVSTVKVKGKTKRFGRTMGRRPDWKKAYVKLAAGQEIDFTSGAK